MSTKSAILTTILKTCYLSVILTLGDSTCLSTRNNGGPGVVRAVMCQGQGQDHTDGGALEVDR